MCLLTIKLKLADEYLTDTEQQAYKVRQIPTDGTWRAGRFTHFDVDATPVPGPDSVMAPPFATLLLRLPFRSLPAGEMGLLSAPLLPFLAGATRFEVLISGAGGRLATTGALGAVWITGAAGSRDLERINEPGSPTIGLSSIYSFPYRRDRLYDSAINCRLG